MALPTLTKPAQEFLVASLPFLGNALTTAKELEYYRVDLWTWFYSEDMIEKTSYTKEQVGGFLSYLSDLGVFAKEDKDWALTEIGVEVAILLT